MNTAGNVASLLQDTETRARSRRIYEEIRQRISLLRYPPGCSLRERELAEEFGVSRTPIRTVLQRLEFEGLTYSRQGHGTIVTSLDIESLKDIYHVRLKLAEMFGPGASPERSDMVDRRLTELLSICQEKQDNASLERFGRINIGLHSALQELISNSTLKDQSDVLFYQTVRMWFFIISNAQLPFEISEVAREIGELQHFLRLGDLDAMGYVRRNYISLVLQRLNALQDMQQQGSKLS